ncbi:hypothetical protein BH20VER1_BH20VER1_28670 [soil metagenome]
MAFAIEKLRANVQRLVNIPPMCASSTIAIGFVIFRGLSSGSSPCSTRTQ